MTAAADLKITGGLFVLALAIGGAGLSFPMLQMVLGLAGVGALGYLLLRPAPFRVELAWPVVAVLALAVLLPLEQLLPLPPALWQSLPGRTAVVQLDQILGWQIWRPWTLDVETTVRSALIMIPGAAVLIGCLRLDGNAKLRLVTAFVAIATVSAILGLIQLVSGGRFTPFPSAHTGYPLGLFVNRNHQALFLLAAIPAAAAIGAIRLSAERAKAATLAITLSILLILGVMVIASTSRMALALSPGMMLVALAILFVGQAKVRLLAPAIGIVIVAGLALWFGGGLTRNLDRFATFGDSRFDYWNDVQWALSHYGLAGTGIGTFVPVHKSAESLSTISSATLNHAHNDYIELLLEGGLAALLLIGLFLAVIAVATLRKLRSRESRQELALSVAALAGIASILLFSLVDYPLRMPAIAALFALFTVLALPRIPKAARAEAPASTESRPWLRYGGRGAALALLTVVAILIVQAGMSSRFLRAGQYDFAAQWAPWSTEAHSRRATEALLGAQDLQAAATSAAAALRLSPIDSPSLRTVGIVAGLSGYPEQSERLLHMATTLGWRDPLTNLWAIEASIRSGEDVKAVQRAEAMFRQRQFIPAAMTALLNGPRGERRRVLLVRELARKPDWRRGFLRSAAALPPSALPAVEQLVIELGRTSAPPVSDELKPLFDRLEESAGPAARQRLWLALRSKALVANGGFEQSHDHRGPELPGEWEISDETLASLSIDRPGASGSAALRIANAPVARSLISQRLLLPPGTYLLDFKVRADQGNQARLRWSLRCLRSGDTARLDFPVTGDSRWRSMSGALTVPDRNCADQRLAFQMIDGDQRARIHLDEVTLSRR